jgi:AAHS family 4-hydroxybenzoate transporter-like MFS transporter
MFGSTIGTVLLGWLMDLISEYLVLFSAFIVAGIFIAAIALHHDNVGDLNWLVFGAGAGMGAITSMPILAAAFYDTRCRATGVSWMLGIGRFGGIFGASIGGYLMTIGWEFRMIFLSLTFPAIIAALTIGAMGLYYSNTAVEIKA